MITVIGHHEKIKHNRNVVNPYYYYYYYYNKTIHSTAENSSFLIQILFLIFLELSR